MGVSWDEWTNSGLIHIQVAASRSYWISHIRATQTGRGWWEAVAVQTPTTFAYNRPSSHSHDKWTFLLVFWSKFSQKICRRVQENQFQSSSSSACLLDASQVHSVHDGACVCACVHVCVRACVFTLNKTLKHDSSRIPNPWLNRGLLILSEDT